MSGSVKDRWQVIVHTDMDFGAQEKSGDVFKRRATLVVVGKTQQKELSIYLPTIYLMTLQIYQTV
jgi:hypothetical protein